MDGHSLFVNRRPDSMSKRKDVYGARCDQFVWPDRLSDEQRDEVAKHWEYIVELSERTARRHSWIDSDELAQHLAVKSFNAFRSYNGKRKHTLGAHIRYRIYYWAKSYVHDRYEYQRRHPRRKVLSELIEDMDCTDPHDPFAEVEYNDMLETFLSYVAVSPFTTSSLHSRNAHDDGKEWVQIRIDTIRDWINDPYMNMLEALERNGLSRPIGRRLVDLVHRHSESFVVRRMFGLPTPSLKGKCRSRIVAMSKRETGEIAERDVQAQVVSAARMVGLALDRRNVGMAVGTSGKPVRFGKRGDPDLTGIIPSGPHRGKRIDVEVKRPGKRPSPIQMKRLREIIDSGGIAFWIDDGYRALHVFRRIIVDGWTVEIDERGVPFVVSPGGDDDA